MNKIVILTVLFFSMFNVSAQDRVLDTVTGKNKLIYNTWSIEANVGSNKAVRPFTTGYATSGDNQFLKITGVNHFDLGVRKMLNTRFGFKFDFASDIVESQEGSTDSKSFQSTQNRIALQGVANVGRLLKFESFTKVFGLLAHGGVQISKFTGKPNGGQNFPNGGRSFTENNGGYMLGLSPQFKITNKLVANFDFSVLINSRQHLAWDGNSSADANNLSGEMNVLSFGLSLYLGNKKEHTDWIVKKDGVIQERIIIKQEKVLSVIENGIDKVEEFIVSFDLNENEPNNLNSDNFKKIINLLIVNNDIKVIIYFFEEGDTENLSITRTNSIKNILVSNSINPERITISKKSVGPLDKKDVKLAKDINILLYKVK